MSKVKLIWTPQAEAAFDAVRNRAAGSGKLDHLLETHNEIVLALGDLELAFQKGELLFKTRKANGEVRLWVNKFISVCYAVYRDERVGWIIKYNAVSENWLD